MDTDIIAYITCRAKNHKIYGSKTAAEKHTFDSSHNYSNEVKDTILHISFLRPRNCRKINHKILLCMASVMLDLWLTSQTQGITDFDRYQFKVLGS